MSTIDDLKSELDQRPAGKFCPAFFKRRGEGRTPGASDAQERADAVAALFTLPRPHLYRNDLIAGSIRGLYVELSEDERRAADEWSKRYPGRNFVQGTDHFAPDYAGAVTEGIPGLLARIRSSKQAHAGEPDRLDFLCAMETTLNALSDRLKAYAQEARLLAGRDGYDRERLAFIAENCDALTRSAPRTFAQGLQLVWMIHVCFVSEGRYAMALGRIDQYLYPLYRADRERGALSDERAVELLAHTFAKIGEWRWQGGDDVVNICIGGVDEDGVCSVNDLSYCVLHAVRDVNMPGPNLSARIAPDCPDRFLDECLKVIGTGLGYPALMNDTVNLAALARKGYELRDVRNYCMVGCIENFIAGKQPPWSDGRFDPIRYLEALLNADAAALDAIGSMDEFMALYEKKLEEGAQEYVHWLWKHSTVTEPEKRTSPFLSCFCDCCIERGLDINMGGARYPSAHGAVLMGIGTVSDSLAAICDVVFERRAVPLSRLAEAVKADFAGFDELRELVLAAPKYGNNDDRADRYAVWYTAHLSDLFDRYRTVDGGPIYTAMAANTSNIYAGRDLGATPDGRLSHRPLSDAASPTYGCDTRGVTATLLSVSKPDYTRCACGTVVNQKFLPSAFRDGKREKLAQLIRVYFARGGQEIQINATSRKVLEDARIHPEQYRNLVVRVSGFSAYYVTLAPEVQEDILSRTQHEDV